MAEHPNVELVRRGYEAYQTGDMDTINALFADDIVFHIPGRSVLAGDYKGKQEVFGFFGRIMEESGGTSKLEVHDVLANDEHAVALVHATATRNGKSHEATSAQVMHIRNGQIVEFWDCSTNPYGDDEFWS